MDAGKIMWVLYEHPEADFQDMAMRFWISVREFTHSRRWVRKHTSLLSQHLQVQVLRLLLSQLSQTRIQALNPLADYQLMPNMAIVDANNMMSAPKGLTVHQVSTL